MITKTKINCSVYTGVRELLKLRIEYLYDIFDLFIIAEADYTLSGHPRQLSLEQDLQDLGLPTDKIQIIQIKKASLPNFGAKYEERYDWVFDCMREHVPENGVVFVNYEDEIPNYNFVNYYATVAEQNTIHNIRMPLAHLSGHSAWRLHTDSGEAVQNMQSYVCRSEHFNLYSPSDFRREKTRDGRWTWVDFPRLYLYDNNVIEDAGWKFQWMGSRQQKWEMYSQSHFFNEHSALGHELRKTHIESWVPVQNGQDPVAVRGHHLTAYDTAKLPAAVQNNEFFFPALEGDYAPLVFGSPQMGGITMAAKKKPKLWIVEDFYDDPDSVREFALNQKYFDDPGFVGRRTREQFFFPNIKEKFEQIMGMRITKWEDYQMNGRFQHNVSGETLTWHTDLQRFAGLIYLTPDAPYNSGTRMAAYKKNRIRHCSDPRIMDCFNQITFKDGTLYEDVDVVGNVYNRLVIYDGGLIHAAQQYFGDCLDNCRLWHMFFFDAE
jgi:hypothetical protein